MSFALATQSISWSGTGDDRIGQLAGRGLPERGGMGEEGLSRGGVVAPRRNPFGRDSRWEFGVAGEREGVGAEDYCGEEFLLKIYLVGRLWVGKSGFGARTAQPMVELRAGLMGRKGREWEEWGRGKGVLKIREWKYLWGERERG